MCFYIRTSHICKSSFFRVNDLGFVSDQRIKVKKSATATMSNLCTKIAIYDLCSGDWRTHSISSRRGWLGGPIQANVFSVLTSYMEGNSFDKSLKSNVRLGRTLYEAAIEQRPSSWPEVRNSLQHFMLLKLSKVEWRGFSGSRGYAHNHICRAPDTLGQKLDIGEPSGTRLFLHG